MTLSRPTIDRTTDTPRTDALVAQIQSTSPNNYDKVDARDEYAYTRREFEAFCSHSRQLERECAAQIGTEKLLRDMLDRAYKMMQMAGYRVVEQNADHNNPIIAWMADARSVLYGNTKPEPKL